MNRFDPKAIIIAMLLSLALDVVGSIALVASFGVQVHSQMTPEETEAAIQAVTSTGGFLFASLLYGTATTVFGGFVAARLARSHPYFNALAIGVLGIVLGLLLGGDAPFWFEALAFLVSVPAAISRCAGSRRAEQPMKHSDPGHETRGLQRAATVMAFHRLRVPMSDLFLPRELFQAASPRPASPASPAAPAPAPRRGTLHFTSGAEVAADLLKAMNVAPPQFVERRRKPRTGKAYDIAR